MRREAKLQNTKASHDASESHARLNLNGSDALTSDLLSSSSVETASSSSSSSPLLLDSSFRLLFFCSFALCLCFFSFFFCRIDHSVNAAERRGRTSGPLTPPSPSCACAASCSCFSSPCSSSRASSPVGGRRRRRRCFLWPTGGERITSRESHVGESRHCAPSS